MSRPGVLPRAATSVAAPLSRAPRACPGRALQVRKSGKPDLRQERGMYGSETNQVGVGWPLRSESLTLLERGSTELPFPAPGLSEFGTLGVAEAGLIRLRLGEGTSGVDKPAAAPAFENREMRMLPAASGANQISLSPFKLAWPSLPRMMWSCTAMPSGF